MNNKILFFGFLLALAVLSSLSPRANAQVTGYNLFKEDFASQTGPSTVVSDEWVATANLTLANSGDASDVTLTAPDSTVYDLTTSNTNPTAYAYQQSFATKAALDAVFPSGANYLYSISGGNSGSDSGTLTFPAEGTGAGELSYPSVVPAYSNYAAIQNLNASQAFTFTFSGFTDITNASAGTSSALFFDIYNASGTDVFSDDFLLPSTTSVTVSAGTLTPGTSYTAVLDYSNRQTTSDSGFVDSTDNGVTPFAGLDYNTSAAFTTAAAPEPATTWMLLAGIGFLALGRRLCRQS